MEAPVVKLELEDGPKVVSTVRRISRGGVPPIAHVGLMPQRHVALFGYGVRDRDAAGAQAVLGVCSRAAGRRSVIHRSRGDSPSTYRASPRASASPRSALALGYERAHALVWNEVMPRWHGKKRPSLCDALRTSDTRGDEGCRTTLALCATVVPQTLK